jgi:hypothetical protein
VLKATDYRSRRAGAWRLRVLPEQWSDDLQKKVLALVAAQMPSKHPQTIEVDAPAARNGKKFYLKIFHGGAPISAIKDIFRSSDAFRFWRQGVAFAAAGFNVPLTIGAGEVRCFRIVRRSFVLTATVDGQPLPVFLADLVNTRERLTTKRNGLMKLARLIQRLHRHGFVHGDLIASNLLVAAAADGHELSFFFMDNDRTHWFPRWLPQSLWKRNLIQLNRMPLPGITLQDRMRFLCAYLGQSQLSSREREFARWIENKTRRRRYECDGVDPTLSFRKLMRWNADIAVRHDRESEQRGIMKDAAG